MRRRLLPILTLSLTLFAAPAAHAADAAGPVSETSHAGSVTATISWQAGTTDYGTPSITGLHLAIVRAGVKAFDGPLAIPGCGEPTCTPFVLAGAATAPRVLVRSIDTDSEPEVLVGAFSGGAHCCTSLVVFDHRSGAYHKSTLALNDAGVRLVNLDHVGAVELLTRDDRFAYTFASYAASWLPVQVLRFQSGSFADVSRSFPFLLRRDAAQAWKYARQQCASTEDFADSLGMYAGWADDQYRLGKRAAALRTLRAEQRRGCFKSPQAGAARTFIARLDRFLLSL